MSRSGSYKLVGLCPSDLHNKGYFCEAAFKVHGSSGLHYILLEVTTRKKLTFEVFKNKKFQENSLIQVRKAVRDVCKVYGIAAALEFSESESFPDQQELWGAADVSMLLLDKSTGQPHFSFMVQFRNCMMHQLHTEMALQVKLCTKHNYQFMCNLDLDIITQKFSVMFAIFLQNDNLQQEGYCSRTVLSTLVGEKHLADGL